MKVFPIKHWKLFFFKYVCVKCRRNMTSTLMWQLKKTWYSFVVVVQKKTNKKHRHGRVKLPFVPLQYKFRTQLIKYIYIYLGGVLKSIDKHRFHNFIQVVCMRTCMGTLKRSSTNCLLDNRRSCHVLCVVPVCLADISGVTFVWLF